MSKIYASKSFTEFVNSSKEYQTQKHFSDSSIEPKSRSMETPIEGMKVNHGAMKAAQSSVKYDPSALTFAQFTDSNRTQKMQSMIKHDTSDGSWTKKGEAPGFQTLPSYAKTSKSFDIDVTKYSPKKAKG